MAVGDLKALLGKALGMEAMLDIFEQAGYRREAVKQAEVDGFPFDHHRGGVVTIEGVDQTRPDNADEAINKRCPHAALQMEGDD